MKIPSTKVGPILIAVLSLSFLSGGAESPWRKIACVDGSSPALQVTQLPLQGDLFAAVRSEAEEAVIKKGALEYYNFLSQNELKYYLDTQAALNGYGVKSPVFANFSPLPWAQYQSQVQNIWNQGVTPIFDFSKAPSLLTFNPGPQLTNLWGFSAKPSLQPFTGMQAAPAAVVATPMQTLLPNGNQSVFSPSAIRQVGISPATTASRIY
ncbi:MAG: hypothetical protein AB7K68_01265 [Bacteriovoracia bacterium]